MLSLSLTPNSVITNNSTINYHDYINNINSDIAEDNYNYSFKKDDILKSIDEFKILYIKTLNEYISNMEYDLAKKYLDEYYYLFTDDNQVNSINNYLINNINKNQLYEYSGDIEILSFNPLISYPQLVLNKKNSSASQLDENNITTDEFKKILLSIYEKNYVLVSPQSLKFNSNTITTLVPKGKKPIVLILEDVRYDTKENGCVEKLILENNNIATYTPKRAINDRISHDNDFITILENFIDIHPSFSVGGARAVLVIDGSKGIFGYNTQKTNATSKYQIKKALEIINYLKTKGYIFASESYGSSINESYINFASGLNSWNTEIEPLIDEKANILFLNSSLENDIDDSTRSKLNLISSYNYSIIIGTETKSRYCKINNMNYMAAKQVSGRSLRHNHDSFSGLFDCEYVYDHINRHITFSE